MTSDHFGTNVVFTRDYLDRGGPFDRIFDQMNFGAMRFPGGTVTEESFNPGGPAPERFFDIYRPSGLLGDQDTGDIDDDEARIVTAPAAIDFANEKDVSFNFVLPTDSYLSDETDDDGERLVSPFGTYRLLSRADSMIRGEFGEIDIDMFIIGNEFWYGVNPRLSAEEYGRIVDDVAVGLNRVFENYRGELDDQDTWDAPKIAAQVSQGWMPEDNEAILGKLSDEARGAIDVAVTHFYPRFYEHVANSQGVFDRLDDWQNADGFDDLEYYISEWNTSREEGSDMGLQQASSMLEITRTMLDRDVDNASIWGVQYQNLTNRLAELDRDQDAVSGGDYRLTPAGELFRMMNPSLQGLQVLDIDTPEELRSDLLADPQDRDPDNRDQLVMHAFSNDDRAVVFLSSRTDEPMEITLDRDGLIPNYSHVWGQKLGVIDDPETDRDEGDPTAPYALPYLTSHTEMSMQGDDGLSITLDPYEIVKFEFTLDDDIGVHLFGHDQVIDPDATYDDTLIGGPGDDLIEAHFGDNLLRGGGGDDTLIGGAGNDTIHGDDGDDLLLSGGGNNRLFGGEGNDTLVADGGGENVLVGGAGVNHFVISVESDTIIEDFRPDEGQTLSFLRHYDSADEVTDRAMVQEDDIVILHDGGGMTELLGAAGHMDILADSLADQMEEAPTDDIVDVLLSEPPDVEIEPDPDPPGDHEELRELLLQLSEMLMSRSESELQEFLDNQDDETLIELTELINPTIPTFATDQIFDVFLNSLPEDALEDYFDRLSSEVLGAQFLRFEAALPSDMLELDGDVLQRTFDKLDPEDGAQWLQRMSDEEGNDLLSRMDEIGVDPARWNWFSSLDEDDDQDDPVQTSGGGCFVATCAYGDRGHPDVVFLQTWRDLVLTEYVAGRAFISLYYNVGPALARLLAPFPRGRAGIRWLLVRLVRSLANAYRVKRVGVGCAA